jgi:hypothetical protein
MHLLLLLLLPPSAAAAAAAAAGEPNIKGALLIAGAKLNRYLQGTYSLGDALAELYQLPGVMQQLQTAASAAAAVDGVSIRCPC